MRNEEDIILHSRNNIITLGQEVVWIDGAFSLAAEPFQVASVHPIGTSFEVESIEEKKNIPCISLYDLICFLCIYSFFYIYIHSTCLCVCFQYMSQLRYENSVCLTDARSGASHLDHSWLPRHRLSGPGHGLSLLGKIIYK